MPAGPSGITSRRTLTFGTWAAAGGLVTTIAADGPMSTATLPIAATSSAAAKRSGNPRSRGSILPSRKEEEGQVFGKAKGGSQEKDTPLPPAPQLHKLPAASLPESASKEVSCIDRGMTVVGKICSEGTLNVFGRVEGELHASIVRISNGAHVEGAITAQELTIGGHFKGTIRASRVAFG
jgi:Polymer-forming cytoskeletal